MSTLEDIQVPIKKELALFEENFKKMMISNTPLLDKITHYIIKRKGKQMRPMFVMLSAGICGGITDRTYRAASLIEMIHTATLVHDDVVDDAMERRGFFSINALWKNKIAVLVGDYLLSKGLQLSADFEDFDFLKLISTATKEMSEGELLQIEKARRLDIEEDVYFDIIRQKTASLIAACCATGAASAGAPADRIQKMKLLGEYIGIAFQIKDDLFDYESVAKQIGKPVGIDIKEKKMTLPLIFALNKANKKEKKWMINVVKNHNENDEKVRELIKHVKSSGGIEYTINKMNEYKDKALSLVQDVPSSEFKSSLKSLITYTIERKK
ncbi:MAG: octaprenyl-diphosphate synthase [Glaciecola sp.]|jgi:octaprenyl-diphosphate synthase